MPQNRWMGVLFLGTLLLSILSALVGGVLIHDANMGLAIGSGVLAVELALIKAMKMLRGKTKL